MLTLPLVAVGASAARAAACEEPADTRIWWSPLEPVAGEPLRLLAVSESPGEATLARGKQALPTVRRGGPPYSFQAEIASPSAGNLRVELRRGEKLLACRTIAVKKSAKDAQQAAGRGRVLEEHAALGSVDRKPVLGLGGIAVRRAGVGIAELPAAGAGPARCQAQLPVRPSVAARGRQQEQGGAAGGAGLCRPAVFPARLFRLEAGAAGGVPRLQPGQQQLAPPLRGADHQRGAGRRQDGAEADAAVPAQAGQHRALGQRPGGAGGPGDRSVSGAADPRGAAAGYGVRRPVRPRAGAGEVGAAERLQRRIAAGGGRSARRQRGAQALLGGDVPVRRRGEERGAGLEGVPAAGAGGRGASGGAGADAQPAAGQGGGRGLPASPTSRARPRPTLSTRA